MVYRAVPLIRLWCTVDAILEPECVRRRERRGLACTRRLLHGAVASGRACRPASCCRLHRLLRALVGRLLRRVAVRRSVLARRGSLRRIRRILGVVPVMNGGVVARRGCLGRALHVNRRLARSGRRVRVGHRRRVWVVNMRLAGGRHELRLSGMNGRASGRRVLGVRAIRRGSRVVRVRWRIRRRIGVRMRGRVCRVDPLAAHVVVHSTFNGTGDSRPSRRRVRCPTGLWREVDTIMLLKIVLSGTPGFTSWERALVVPLPGMDTSMPREVTARGEWPGARRADMLLLGLLGSGVRGGSAGRRGC